MELEMDVGLEMEMEEIKTNLKGTYIYPSSDRYPSILVRLYD